MRRLALARTLNGRKRANSMNLTTMTNFMLEASCYDDLAAVDEMINGADLTGQVPVTGVLPGKFNPGLLMDEALNLRATLLRGRGASLACSSGDPEVGAGVWAQTLEEVSSGWKAPGRERCHA